MYARISENTRKDTEKKLHSNNLNWRRDENIS